MKMLAWLARWFGCRHRNISFPQKPSGYVVTGRDSGKLRLQRHSLGIEHSHCLDCGETIPTSLGGRS